jgi:hypothetical protein
MSPDTTKLLKMLASDFFRGLRNYGDRWGVLCLSWDGVSFFEVFYDNLDAAVEGWFNLETAVDCAEEDAAWERECQARKDNESAVRPRRTARRAKPGAVRAVAPASPSQTKKRSAPKTPRP